MTTHKWVISISDLQCQPIYSKIKYGHMVLFSYYCVVAGSWKYLSRYRQYYWSSIYLGFGRNFESKLAREPVSKYGAVFLWAGINADLWLHFCAEPPKHRVYESRILMLCAAVYSTFTAPQPCLHRCSYLCAWTSVSFSWSKRILNHLSEVLQMLLFSLRGLVSSWRIRNIHSHMFKSFYLQVQ